MTRIEAKSVLHSAAYRAPITEKEAKRVIDAYYTLFPSLRKFSMKYRNKNKNQNRK